MTAGIITAGSYRGDGSQLTGISVGITTQAITPSGITTHLLLDSADDHKVLATGNVTIDVTGGTEAGNHVIRIENVGVATVGFSTAFKFPSGGTPSLPFTSGSISLISFTVHKVGASGMIYLKLQVRQLIIVEVDNGKSSIFYQPLLLQMIVQ